ncbi:hypothetical protein STEG23_020449 [Scotinomys teguina]
MWFFKGIYGPTPCFCSSLTLHPDSTAVVGNFLEIGVMAQQLRALIVVPDDNGLISSIYMVTRNYRYQDMIFRIAMCSCQPKSSIQKAAEKRTQNPDARRHSVSGLLVMGDNRFPYCLSHFEQ